MIRAAMIGSGFIGAQHARAYAMLSDVQLVAILDTNEAVGHSLAKQYGCAYYSDAGKLFELADFDYVDICVPTFLHRYFIEMAAQHNKHVLCEKPFALSEEDCRSVACVCAKANVRLMVAQSERWSPHIKVIRKMIRNGEIGEEHMATLFRLAQHPNWTNWHRDPVKSGGGLFDLQVHDIDLLIHMFGEVESVYALGWKNAAGCWNHVSAVFKFKSGANAISEGSLEMVNGYPFTYGIRIIGSRAGAEYEYHGGFNNEQCDDALTRFAIYHEDSEPMLPELASNNEYAEEIEAFASAIKTNTPMPIPIQESIYVIHIVEAIRLSLETGERVFPSRFSR